MTTASQVHDVPPSFWGSLCVPVGARRPVLVDNDPGCESWICVAGEASQSDVGTAAGPETGIRAQRQLKYVPEPTAGSCSFTTGRAHRGLWAACVFDVRTPSSASP